MVFSVFGEGGFGENAYDNDLLGVEAMGCSLE